MKDLILLAIRLYFGVSLLCFAEQGGIAKFNWGVSNISTNLVAPLGFPFDMFPLGFSYLVVAAELCGPILIITGIMAQLGAFLLSCHMAVATYAHLVVWQSGFWSTLENKSNVHGSLIYLMFALCIFVVGPGKFTLGIIFGGKKQKSN